uniref:Uncharacterized protein n=1 Tax=viral metagenome TaxID=1070528 RepID=A0A6C0JFM4_9ZZZZ
MTSKSILKSLKRITKEIKKINYNLIINHSKMNKFNHEGTHVMKNNKKNKIISPGKADICDDEYIKKIIKNGGL